MNGSAARLWARQFRADPWVVVALAVLTFLIAVLLTAVPRAMSTITDQQLEQAVGSISSFQRDLTASFEGMAPPQTDSFQEDPNPWPPMQTNLAAAVEAQPEPLAGALGEVQFLRMAVESTTYTPPLATGFYGVFVERVVNPDLMRVFDLVEGRVPALTEDGAPAEVALSAEAAERLGLGVGDEVARDFVLVGVLEATDPEDPRWESFDLGDRLSVEVDPNRGEAARVWAYLAPDHDMGLLENNPTPVSTRIRIPVEPTALSGGLDVAGLHAQLTNMMGRYFTVLDEAQAFPYEPVDVRFDSQLGETLQRVVSQQAAALALVAVVAAGPVGVAIAVMLLGSQLAILRRRPSSDLALARGASPQQLRTMVAWEGALLSVPAALLGNAVAVILFDGVSPWWQWLVTAVVGVALPLALVLSMDRVGPRGRADLTSRGGRRRLAVELGIVVLAAAATWQLLTRRPEPTPDLDLLASATPLLLALAAGVVTLRVFPLPLVAVSGMLRRGKSITGHLGSARALRDPAGGLVPILAVLLGTTVAVLSTMLLGTVDRGAQVAMWTDNGAAVRISGPRITDEMVTELDSLDGVAAVGRMSQTATNRELQVPQSTQSVRVWVLEDSLAEVWNASPLVESAPLQVFANQDPPRIMTGGQGPTYEGEAHLGLIGPVLSLGHLPTLPGMQAPGSWAVISQDTWEEAGGGPAHATVALLSLEEGADAAAVMDQARGIVGSAMITSADERLTEQGDNVVVGALGVAFVGAVVATVVLTVIALVVVQLMGAPARANLLAVLRTLGLRRGEARSLVAWELGPLVIASLAVGAVLGWAIAGILVRTLDLTGLTGGVQAPALYLDWLLLAGVLAAVLLTLILAVTITAWLAGRANLAQALRMGEPR